MILILIALIATVTLSILIVHISINELIEVIGVIFAMVGITGLLIYSFVGYEYIAAGYKKDLINAEFNTEYTQAQIFYASDVIDEIRELKRQRIELNGNLIHGE